MRSSRILLGSLLGLALVAGPAFRSLAADKAEDEMVKAIINLVTDKDGDVRSVGLEQVREQAKGEAATRQFAALLPTFGAGGPGRFAVGPGRPGRSHGPARRVGDVQES